MAMAVPGAPRDARSALLGGGGSQTQTSGYPPEIRDHVFDQIRGNIAVGNDIAAQPYSPYQVTTGSLAAPVSGRWEQLSQEQRNQVARGFGYGGEAAGGQFAAYLDQDPARRAAFDRQSAAGSFTGLPVTQTGQPVAGLTPDQQAAIDRIRGNAGGQAALGNAETIANRVGGYTPALIRDADLSSYMNPYAQSVIDTTLSDLSRQNDVVQNRTRARMAGAGAFGSQGTLAETENDRNYLDTVARTTAGLNQANYANALAAAAQDAGLGLQGANLGLSAANLLSGLGMQQQRYGLNDAQALLGAGSLVQANAQQKLDAGYQEHLRQQQHPIQMLGIRQGVLGGPLPTQTTTTGSTRGALDRVLDGAGAFGSTYNLLTGNRLGGLFGL